MLSVLLIGTMAPGDEIQPTSGGTNLDTILEAIMGLWQNVDVMNDRMSGMDERVSNMEGRMINVEGNLNSSNTTPQNTLQASSSGQAQETSTTIFPRAPHNIFYPPPQVNVPLPTTTVDQTPRHVVRPLQFNPPQQIPQPQAPQMPAPPYQAPQNQVPNYQMP